jgi:hypothetical protein
MNTEDVFIWIENILERKLLKDLIENIKTGEILCELVKIIFF